MLARAAAMLSSRPRASEGASGLRPTVKSSALIHRASAAHEQAAMILFVASREASYMTGALVANDGGWTAY